MKIFYHPFLLLLLVIANAINAQTVKLRGTVRDSISSLTGAHISIFGRDAKPLAETLTDSTGRFQFQLTEKREYRIEVKHLGYNLYQQAVVINGDTDLGILTLRSRSIHMQEVVRVIS